jgi:hypothetical protein
MEVIKNFCLFISIYWYTPAEKSPPNPAEANKILANDELVKWLSKQTDQIKQRLKDVTKISGV